MQLITQRSHAHPRTRTLHRWSRVQLVEAVARRRKQSASFLWDWREMFAEFTTEDKDKIFDNGRCRITAVFIICLEGTSTAAQQVNTDRFKCTYVFAEAPSQMANVCFCTRGNYTKIAVFYNWDVEAKATAQTGTRHRTQCRNSECE